MDGIENVHLTSPTNSLLPCTEPAWNLFSIVRLRFPTCFLPVIGLITLLGYDVRAKNPTIAPADVTFFENKIRPVLADHCFECHSKDAKKLGGKLRLDDRDAFLRGGESGPVFVAGNPAGKFNHSIAQTRRSGDAPRIPVVRSHDSALS